MDDLKLYIDRLRANEYKEYSFVAAPSVMGEADKEASFNDPISVNVSATLANDHMVFDTSIETNATIYCKICNEPISHKLLLEEKHTALPIKKIKNGVFLLEDHVRELIFLNLPRFSECGGKCPEREALKEYLKPSDQEDLDN